MSGLKLTNQSVQRLRRLLARRADRHADGLFVVEGPVFSAEAVQAGWTCVAQYSPEGSGVLIDGAGPLHELAVGVLDKVGTTQAPQAPLTLVEIPGTRRRIAARQFGFRGRTRPDR